MNHKNKQTVILYLRIDLRILVLDYCADQCDQIERFIGLWATFFKSFGNNKGVKIIHFSCEIIFGQLL